MDDKLFDKLYPMVMKMLRDQLPPHLYYHNPEHTIDVIQSAERIAVSEGCSLEEILLLKLAALFHDTGYVTDMREHEKHGCEIAREMLSINHVDTDKINIICGIIMATKIPQSPKTKLEKIICDADLDYLGRTDYLPISENLHREFLAFEKIKNDKEWIELQQTFLQSHSYFTKTSVALRQTGVEENLRKIGEKAEN
ncbi:MAG: HD domain-containing protein [Bacteroidetes bacterium]|nr:HD domain-containing protein [Bacteroidota bacterium]